MSSNKNLKKFSNLLRMYTPVGQLNDFVLHPAYHNYRKGELDIKLKVINDAVGEKNGDVEFDFFRVCDKSRWAASYEFDDYISTTPSPSNASVHVIDRIKMGGGIFLTAAEIQSSKVCLHEIREEMVKDNELPLRKDEGTDNEIVSISQGFGCSPMFTY